MKGSHEAPLQRDLSRVCVGRLDQLQNYARPPATAHAVPHRFANVLAVNPL